MLNTMLPLAMNGKSDDIQLNSLISYLEITHKIPKHTIKKDWYILFDNSNYNILQISSEVTKEQMQSRPKPLIRHPDIMVFRDDDDERQQYNSRTLDYVIELDGKSHYHYRPHRKCKWQKKKDVAVRNMDYHYANIPLIIIDILEMSYLKKSWFVHLDEELKKLGKI